MIDNIIYRDNRQFFDASQIWKQGYWTYDGLLKNIHHYIWENNQATGLTGKPGYFTGYDGKKVTVKPFSYDLPIFDNGVTGLNDIDLVKSMHKNNLYERMLSTDTTVYDIETLVSLVDNNGQKMSDTMYQYSSHKLKNGQIVKGENIFFGIDQDKVDFLKNYFKDFDPTLSKNNGAISTYSSILRAGLYRDDLLKGNALGEIDAELLNPIGNDQIKRSREIFNKGLQNLFDLNEQNKLLSGEIIDLDGTKRIVSGNDYLLHKVIDDVLSTDIRTAYNGYVFDEQKLYQILNSATDKGLIEKAQKVIDTQKERLIDPQAQVRILRQMGLGKELTAFNIQDPYYKEGPNGTKIPIARNTQLGTIMEHVPYSIRESHDLLNRNALHDAVTDTKAYAMALLHHASALSSSAVYLSDHYDIMSANHSSYQALNFSNTANPDSYHMFNIKQSLYNEQLPVMVFDANQEGSILVQKNGHRYRQDLSGISKDGFVGSNESIAGILRKGKNIAISQNIESFEIDETIKKQFYEATGHMPTTNEVVMMRFKIATSNGFEGNYYMAGSKEQIFSTLNRMGVNFGSAQLDQSGKIVSSSNLNVETINHLLGNIGSTKRYQKGSEDQALKEFMGSNAKYYLTNTVDNAFENMNLNKALVLNDLVRIHDKDTRNLYLRMNQLIVDQGMNKKDAFNKVLSIDGITQASSNYDKYEKAYNFMDKTDIQRKLYKSTEINTVKGIQPIFKSSAWSMSNLMDIADHNLLRSYASNYLNIAAKAGYKNASGDFSFNSSSDFVTRKLNNIYRQSLRMSNAAVDSTILSIGADQLTPFMYDKITPSRGLNLTVTDTTKTIKDLHRFAESAAKGSRGSENVPVSQTKNVLYQMLEFFKNNGLIDTNKNNLTNDLLHLAQDGRDTSELITKYIANDLNKTHTRQLYKGALNSMYKRVSPNIKGGVVTLDSKGLNYFNKMAGMIDTKLVYDSTDATKALAEHMMSRSTKARLLKYYDNKELGSFVANSIEQTIQNLASSITSNLNLAHMTIDPFSGVQLHNSVGEKLNISHNIPMIVFEEGVPYIKVGGNTYSISLSTRYLKSSKLQGKSGPGYIALGIEQLEPFNEIASKISKTKVKDFGSLSAIQMGLNSISQQIYDNTTHMGYQTKTLNSGMYNYVARSNRVSSSAYSTTNIGFKPILKDLPAVFNDFTRNGIIGKNDLDDYLMKVTKSNTVEEVFEKLGFDIERNSANATQVNFVFNKTKSSLPGARQIAQDILTTAFDNPLKLSNGYEARNIGELIMLSSQNTGSHRYVKDPNTDSTYLIINKYNAKLPLQALSEGFYNQSARKASLSELSLTLSASNSMKQIAPGSDMASGRFMHTHLQQMSRIEESNIDELSRLTGMDYSSLKNAPTVRRFDDRSAEHAVNGSYLVSSNYEDISKLRRELDLATKDVIEEYRQMGPYGLNINNSVIDNIDKQMHHNLRNVAEGSASVAQELADIHHMTGTSSHVQSVQIKENTIHDKYLDQLMPIKFNSETGMYEGLDSSKVLYFKDGHTILKRQSRSGGEIYHEHAKGDVFGKVVFKDNNTGKFLTPKEIADLLNDTIKYKAGEVDFNNLSNIFKELNNSNISVFFNAKSVGSQTTMKIVKDSTKHVANSMGKGVGTVFQDVGDIFKKNGFGHYVGQIMDYDALKLLVEGDLDVAAELFSSEAVKNGRYVPRNYNGKAYSVVDDIRLRKIINKNIKGFRSHLDSEIDSKYKTNLRKSKLLLRDSMFGNLRLGSELNNIEDFVKFQKVQDYMASRANIRSYIDEFEKIALNIENDKTLQAQYKELHKIIKSGNGDVQKYIQSLRSRMDTLDKMIGDTPLKGEAHKVQRIFANGHGIDDIRSIGESTTGFLGRIKNAAIRSPKNQKAGELDRFLFGQLKIKDATGQEKTLFELEEHNIVNDAFYNGKEMRKFVADNKRLTREQHKILSEFEKIYGKINVGMNLSEVHSELVKSDYIHRALPHVKAKLDQELLGKDAITKIVKGNITALRNQLSEVASHAGLSATELLFRERNFVTEILNKHHFTKTGYFDFVLGIAGHPEDVKRAEPINLLRRMIDSTMETSMKSNKIRAKFNSDSDAIRKGILDFLNHSGWFNADLDNGKQLFELDPNNKGKILINGRNLRINSMTLGDFKKRKGAADIIHKATKDDEFINPLYAMFQEMNRDVFDYELGNHLHSEQNPLGSAAANKIESMMAMNFLIASKVGEYQKGQFLMFGSSFGSKTVTGSLNASEQDSLLAISLRKKDLEWLHSINPNDPKLTEVLTEMNSLENKKRDEIFELEKKKNPNLSDAEARKIADRHTLAFHPFHSFKSGIEDPDINLVLYGAEEMKNSPHIKTMNFGKDIYNSKEFKDLDPVSQKIALMQHQNRNSFSKEWLGLKRDVTSSLAALVHEQDQNTHSVISKNPALAIFKERMKDKDSAEALAYKEFDKPAKDITERVSKGIDSLYGQRYRVDFNDGVSAPIEFNVPSYKGHDEIDNNLSKIESSYRKYNESIELMSQATEQHKIDEYARNASTYKAEVTNHIQSLNDAIKNDAYKKGKANSVNFYQLGRRTSGQAKYLSMDALEYDKKIFSKTAISDGQGGVKYITQTVKDVVDAGYTPAIAEVNESFFERMGILNKKMTAAERAAKISELETEGVAMAISRYPNNYQKSISFAKVYLNNNVSSEHIAGNHFLQAKMNADNDGDWLYATNLADSNLAKSMKGFSAEMLPYFTAMDNSISYMRTSMYENGELVDRKVNAATEMKIHKSYQDSLETAKGEFDELLHTSQLTANAGAPYHSIKNLNNLVASTEIAESALAGSSFGNKFSSTNNIFIGTFSNQEDNMLRISDRRAVNLFSIGAIESGLSAKNVGDKEIAMNISNNIRQIMGSQSHIHERMELLSNFLDTPVPSQHASGDIKTNWDSIFDSLFKKETDLQVLIDSTVAAEHSLVASGKKTYQDYRFKDSSGNLINDAKEWEEAARKRYKENLSNELKKATQETFQRVGERVKDYDTRGYNLSVRQHDNLLDYLSLDIAKNGNRDYNSYDVNFPTKNPNADHIEATKITEGILSSKSGEIAGRDILTEIAAKRSKSMLGMAMGAGASILLAGMGTQNPVPQIDNSVTAPMDDNVMIRQVQAPSGNNSGYLINVRTANTDGGAMAAALMNSSAIALGQNRQNITVTTRVNQQYTDMPITEAMNYLSNIF